MPANGPRRVLVLEFEDYSWLGQMCNDFHARMSKASQYKRITKLNSGIAEARASPNAVVLFEPSIIKQAKKVKMKPSTRHSLRTSNPEASSHFSANAAMLDHQTQIGTSRAFGTCHGTSPNTHDSSLSQIPTLPTFTERTCQSSTTPNAFNGTTSDRTRWSIGRPARCTV